MQTVPIPFGDGQASGLDELSGASPLLRNFLVDAAGSLRPRPGTSTYYTGSAITADGTGNEEILELVVWNGMVVYVTADRWFHTLTDTGTIRDISTSTATTQLLGSGRPVFAKLATALVCIGDGAPQVITGTTPSSLTSARLGGSPPNGTHIAVLDQRLVINKNDGTGDYQWSADDDTATWPAANIEEAEVRPDSLLAVYENSRLLWLFGATTTQIHSIGADPLRPFEYGNSFNDGIGGIYSPIRKDDDFFWLDNNRRFVVSNGQGFTPISTPDIARTIDSLTTIEDCWGYRRRIDAFDHLVWLFPTEKRAFAYDMERQGWSEEPGTSSGGLDIAPAYGAYEYWPDENKHLVGMTNGTGVQQLSTAVTTDVSVAFRCEATSGFVDGGSNNRKRWCRNTFVVRRGVVTYGSDDQSFEVCHRDDLGAFSEWRSMSIGVESDYEATLIDYCGGVSRRRQFRLRYSGTVAFTLARAFADFEALGD